MEPLEPSTLVYRPLDDSRPQIRLINILPAHFAGEMVSCKLDYVFLSEVPKYHALSYCWGNSDLVATILIDDVYVQITRSLVIALRYLRYHGHLRVWADAICINQKDTEERGKQVSMMTSIYQASAEVDAWISNERSWTEKAVTLLRSFTLLSPSSECKALLEPLNKGKHEAFDNWLIIRYFFEAPFWLRVWIIQEVTCGRPVNIMSGSCIISWEELLKAMSIIERKAKVPIAVFSPRSPSFLNVKALQQLRVDRAAGRPIYLIDALFNTRLALATEALDKVFALLGISCDGKNYVPNLRYGQNEDNLYLEMFQSIVQRTGTLDWMFLAEEKRHPLWADSPALFSTARSFVPIWPYIEGERTSQMINYLRSQGLVSGQRCFGKAKSSVYTATLGTRPDIEYKDNNLRAVGVYIDSIDGLCQTSEPPRFKLSPVMQSASSSNAYGTLGQGVDALHRTLLLDQQSTKISLPFGDLSDGSAFTIYGQPINSLTIIRKWVYLVSTSLRRVSSQRKRPAQFNSGWNRFMTTQNGYVGWAPRLAEKGDGIYLLKGCSMPVVLRPSNPDQSSKEGGIETALVFIGPAYIHGVMEGDYMGRVRETDWQPLTIV